MKIQCTLSREGGTRAEIGGIEYYFEPLADGAFAADIEREDHIDRLLAIPEGYKVYHGKLDPKGKPQTVGPATATPASAPAPAPTGVMLAGSELLPPQFEIGGRVVTQLEAAKLAFEASGLTSDQWNDLGDDERAAKIEIALDEMADGAETHTPDGDLNADGEVNAEDERIALAAAYKAKFGKAPHHKKSIAAIKAELEA